MTSATGGDVHSALDVAVEAGRTATEHLDGDEHTDGDEDEDEGVLDHSLTAFTGTPPHRRPGGGQRRERSWVRAELGGGESGHGAILGLPPRGGTTASKA